MSNDFKLPRVKIIKIIKRFRENKNEIFDFIKLVEFLV
jgi:hypothetical protein